MISDNEDCGTGKAAEKEVAEELAKAERQAAIEEECSQLKVEGENGWEAYTNEHIFINNSGHLVTPRFAKYISKEACLLLGDRDCEGKNGSRKYTCRPGGHARTCQALNSENIPSFDQCVANGGYEEPSDTETANPNKRAIISRETHPKNRNSETGMEILRERSITHNALVEVECGTPNSIEWVKGSQRMGTAVKVCMQFVYTHEDCRPGEVMHEIKRRETRSRGGGTPYIDIVGQ
jgi:hypothetical protein